MINLDIKIKVSFKSQNFKKVFFFPTFSFLMILNKMFQFELHPHVGENRREILVYKKRLGNTTYKSSRKNPS